MRQLRTWEARRIWNLARKKRNTATTQPHQTHSRPLNVAEPRPFDVDAWVALARRLADLVADVLALEIAVGPDDERLRGPRLGLDVLGDLRFILVAVVLVCTVILTITQAHPPQHAPRGPQS